MNLIKTCNNKITVILLINYMYCCPCLRLRAHLSSRDYMYIPFDLKLSFNVIGLSILCYVYKIRLASFSCLGLSLHK